MRQIVRSQLLFLLVFACIAACTGSLLAQGDKKDTPDARSEPSLWMKRKLEYSKAILGGLAESDFEAIAENAEAMRRLARIEAFIRGRSPEYRTQMQIFLEANQEIVRQADRKNLEGASLGFTQLTISCVNCHKQLRAAPREEVPPGEEPK